MTLDDTDVVDIVAEGASGELALVIVAPEPWDDPSAQADALMAKINTYVDFALSSELLKTVPEAAGKSLRIQLDCTHAPKGQVAEVAELCRREMKERFNIGFTVNLLT